MTIWSVETVIIPLHKPGAVSLCLSSQVGCAMGCQFCATARMPRRRNLETWEILDQFVQARELARADGPAGHGRRVHGDGRAVPELRAGAGRRRAPALPLRRLDRGQGDHHQHRRAGAGDRPIHRGRAQATGWPISLGAATDAKRARLVPLAARTPVAEVMAAARRHALIAPGPRHARLRLHRGREHRRGRRPGPRRADRRHAGPARPDRRHRPDRPVPAPRSGRAEGVPRRADAARRPADRPPLLGRQGHPGGLRHAGGAEIDRRSAAPEHLVESETVAAGAAGLRSHGTCESAMRRARSCLRAEKSSMTACERWRNAERLAGDPRLGMGERLEDAPAVPGRALDDALVDQEKQDGGRVLRAAPATSIPSRQRSFSRCRPT